MQTLTLTLRPLSAFGTPLLGDTLFGQLCWVLRDLLGEQGLRELLEGYTRGQPFAVVSDAFPQGYVLRPSVPLAWFRQEDADRKALKKKTYLPIAALDRPLTEWLARCQSDSEVCPVRWYPQPHNSIHRLTGTTGKGAFAPYTLDRFWYAEEVRLDVHLVFDAERIAPGTLKEAFVHLGQMGFGRDASIGLGKFAVEQGQVKALFRSPQPNAALTLAPCAPQGLGFDPKTSFYQLLTRFGRHGRQAVHTGRPFKAPILLAKTGAVFSPVTQDTCFVGQGLGGDGQLSKALPETVHQGYAPVIPIQLPEVL